MNWFTKAVLAATGVGAVVLVADHFRPKAEVPTLRYCPGCQDYIDSTEQSFAEHYAFQHQFPYRRRRA